MNMNVQTQCNINIKNFNIKKNISAKILTAELFKLTVSPCRANRSYHHEPAHALFFLFAPRTCAPICPAWDAITDGRENEYTEREEEREILGEAGLKPVYPRSEGEHRNHSAIQAC